MKPLPLIDFCDLKHETPTWESVKTQVGEAMEEYGCFVAKFDEIPPHVRKSVLDAMQQLFDLPLPTKSRYTSDIPGLEYTAYSPLSESIGIQIHDIQSGEILAFTNFMWPQGNPTFSKSVESYVEQLSDLDKTVRRMVLESLGLEKYWDEHINSTRHFVKFQKYDGPRSQEAKQGLVSHTDKNIVTILYQNGVTGLQVQTKDGDWITVEHSPNCFVVMAGDCFHAWTNGRVHSPFHRVMMTGDKDRYSVALFSIPKLDYIIQAPDEIVDAEHPLLYKPFVYDEFYKSYYYSQAERGSFKDALKAYEV